MGQCGPDARLDGVELVEQDAVVHHQLDVGIVGDVRQQVLHAGREARVGRRHAVAHGEPLFLHLVLVELRGLALVQLLLLLLSLLLRTVQQTVYTGAQTAQTDAAGTRGLCALGRSTAPLEGWGGGTLGGRRHGRLGGSGGRRRGLRRAAGCGCSRGYLRGHRGLTACY